MTIQPIPVTRNADGHWKHPDLPEWNGTSSTPELEYWLTQQGLQSRMLQIGPRIPQEAINRWLAGESGRPDDMPKHYSLRDNIVLAVYQAEEFTIVWLGTLTHHHDQRSKSNEVYSAA